MRPALEYIERNYTEKIPIEFLAQLCNFSQARFFTLFKAATGCTPIEYKNNILIQNGVKLLAESQMSVEEISDTLGFSSVAYFRRVFKNITKKNAERHSKNARLISGYIIFSASFFKKRIGGIISYTA